MSGKSPRPFNPEMLVLARGMLGLSQAELARRLGWTQSKLSKVEAGLIGPADQDIPRFASELDANEKLFFEPEVRQSFGSACDVFHRKRNTTPVRAVNMLRDQINFKRIQVNKLLQNVEVESDFKFPSLDIDAFDGNAEQIAQLVRSTWQIAHGPINDLVDVIERAGAIVIEHEMPHERIDAVSQFPKELIGPIILLNKSIPVDRWRLTLAHEIGHLVMHRVPSATQEEEANRFAAEFLMPEAEIKGDLVGISVRSAAQLKLKWRVSMQALVVRAKELGVITDSRYKSLFVQMSRLGYRKNEPANLTPETPKALKSLIEFHLTALKYKKDELADLVLSTRDVFSESFLHKPKLRLVK